jgi:hypothetical protein
MGHFRQSTEEISIQIVPGLPLRRMPSSAMPPPRYSTPTPRDAISSPNDPSRLPSDSCVVQSHWSIYRLTASPTSRPQVLFTVELSESLPPPPQTSSPYLGRPHTRSPVQVAHLGLLFLLTREQAGDTWTLYSLLCNMSQFLLVSMFRLIFTLCAARTRCLVFRGSLASEAGL